MKNEPLPTIQELIKEPYVQAKAVFWAGSVSESRGTTGSDLDPVIVFEEVTHAYREALIDQKEEKDGSLLTQAMPKIVVLLSPSPVLILFSLNVSNLSQKEPARPL